MKANNTNMIESHEAEIDGITTRWLESGQGNPVVFIHGIPTSPALWRHVVSRLDGVRCLCWEMIGYGSSIPEGLRRDISVENQAICLIAWMNHLQIERAVLVGHDLGGGVAQIAATRSPSQCAGLVLVNSICYDSWPIPSVRFLRRMGGLVERLPKSIFRHIFQAFLRRGHHDQERYAESADLHWQYYADHDAAAAFLHQIQCLDSSSDTFGIAQALGRRRDRLPTRVVWGTADPYQKIAYGERLARELHTELIRISNGKHFIPEDEPEPIVSAIEKLADGVEWMDPVDTFRSGATPIPDGSANGMGGSRR